MTNSATCYRTGKDASLFAGGRFNVYEFRSTAKSATAWLDNACTIEGDYTSPSVTQVATDIAKQAHQKDLDSKDSLPKKGAPMKEYKKLTDDAGKTKSWLERLAGIQKTIWNACSNALSGISQNDPTIANAQDPMPSELQLKPLVRTPLKPF